MHTTPSQRGAIFLSYAREDAEPARRLAEALRAFGVDVWFDQNELRGGDAWDQKIRGQIRACTLFVPIISRNTEDRTEGYFRREWKLAVDRTQDMAGGRTFLVPVVIDDTPEGDAAVPEDFLRYQWMRLPNGEPTPEFVAQIKRLLDAPKSGVARGTKSSHPMESSTDRSAHAAAAAAAAKKSGLPFWAWGAIAALGIGAGVAVVAFRDSGKAEPAAATAAVAQNPAVSSQAEPARAADKSIAVLPFIHMSDEKDSSFFTDGMHEDVLTNLALIRELKVISRTTVGQYRDSKKSVREIGEELKVAYILEGSVRRVGDKVRVSGQLIHAASDEHVWAGSFDRDLTDVFAIQTEISRQIAGALKAALSPEESAFISRKPTDNPVAYDLFLRARDKFNRSSTITISADRTREEVIELLNSAVEHDPRFAEAWGLIATMYGQRLINGLGSSEDLARGDAAIARAVELAPDSPEIIHASGHYAYTARRDYATARQRLKRALNHLPNDPNILFFLGSIDRREGRWVEGIRGMKRACELDPANLLYLRNLLISLVRVRDWEAAEAVQQRIVALNVGDRAEQFQLARVRFTMSGSVQGFEDAIAAMSPEEKESPFGRYQRKRLANLTGDYAEFKRLDALLPEFPDEEEPELSAVHAALMFLAHGDTELSGERASAAIRRLKAGRDPSSLNHISRRRLAVLLAVSGRHEEALLLARRNLEEIPYEKDAVTATYSVEVLARIHALAGDTDRTIETLQLIFSRPHVYFSVHDIRSDPAFFKMRGEPRFEALLSDPKNHAPLF